MIPATAKPNGQRFRGACSGYRIVCQILSPSCKSNRNSTPAPCGLPLMANIFWDVQAVTPSSSFRRKNDFGIHPRIDRGG